MTITIISAAETERISDAISSWNPGAEEAAMAFGQNAPGTVSNSSKDLIFFYVGVRNMSGVTPTILRAAIFTNDQALGDTPRLVLTSYSGNPVMDTGNGALTDRDYTFYLFYATDVGALAGYNYRDDMVVITEVNTASTWCAQQLFVLESSTGTGSWELMSDAVIESLDEADGGGTAVLTMEGDTYNPVKYRQGLVCPVLWATRLDANTDGIVESEVTFGGASDSFRMMPDYLELVKPDGLWDMYNVGKAVVGSDFLLFSDSTDQQPSLTMTVDWNPVDGPSDGVWAILQGFRYGAADPSYNQNRYTQRRFIGTSLPYDLVTIRLGGE